MTETDRLYDKNAYLTSCTAAVISIRRIEAPEGGAADSADKNGREATPALYEAVLDRTVFFPEAGGQSSDTGWICAIDRPDRKKELLAVTDVQIKDGVIRHILSCSADSGAPFRAGEPVSLQINWERRFGFMQNHTGEHILSGLMHRRLGFDNIGFHLSDNSVTLDVNGQLNDEEILVLEWEANEVIYRNLPVEVSYPTDEELEKISYRSKIEIEGQTRLVRIPDTDICACCAPHVSRTGEIGLIKIVKVLRYNGGMRLFIACGRRALALMQKRQRWIEEVSHLTNRSQDEIGDGVKHLLGEIGDLKQKNRDLEYEAAFLRLKTVPRDRENVFLFVGNMDPIVHRNLVNRMCEEHEGFCGAFAGSDEEGRYRYYIASRTKDSREVQKILTNKLGAKGGGKPEMIQGSVTGTQSAISAVLP
ncbi:MAG: alanyl-tRNA editing protein [Lachnospiraceae bacterium]|nr:alanyl-tRNA editing protein [Lachnospiraceae bacterium]